jgi:molybdopterin/thiamine biosynthesis adenylyltransferase
VGTIQAAEALKLITGVGQPLTGRLLMIDGRAMEFTEMCTSRQTGCAVCAPR